MAVPSIAFTAIPLKRLRDVLQRSKEMDESMAHEDAVVEVPNIHSLHSTKAPEFWNLETNKTHSLWE